MSRRSEFKKRFDPEMGKYTRQHIWGQTTPSVYGEGIIKDKLKLFAKKALTKAVNKSSEKAGKKAGDKIVSMLSKEKTPKTTQQQRKTTQQQRNARVNSILTGGKII